MDGLGSILEGQTSILEAQGDPFCSLGVLFRSLVLHFGTFVLYLVGLVVLFGGLVAFTATPVLRFDPMVALFEVFGRPFGDFAAHLWGPCTFEPMRTMVF